MLAAPLIDWGFAATMRGREREAGHLHVVKPVGSAVLVAVVSGAARVAVAVLDRHAANGCGITWPNTDRGNRPARATLLTRGGIVDSKTCCVPRSSPLAPRDTLSFTSDGVGTPFADDLPGDASPQDLVERILARNGKGTVDALVLVPRDAGGTGGETCGPRCRQSGLRQRHHTGNGGPIARVLRRSDDFPLSSLWHSH